MKSSQLGARVDVHPDGLVLERKESTLVEDISKLSISTRTRSQNKPRANDFIINNTDEKFVYMNLHGELLSATSSVPDALKPRGQKIADIIKHSRPTLFDPFESLLPYPSASVTNLTVTKFSSAARGFLAYLTQQTLPDWIELQSRLSMEDVSRGAINGSIYCSYKNAIERNLASSSVSPSGFNLFARLVAACHDLQQVCLHKYESHLQSGVCAMMSSTFRAHRDCLMFSGPLSKGETAFLGRASQPDYVVSLARTHSSGFYHGASRSYWIFENKPAGASGPQVDDFPTAFLSGCRAQYEASANNHPNPVSFVTNIFSDRVTTVMIDGFEPTTLHNLSLRDPNSIVPLSLHLFAIAQHIINTAKQDLEREPVETKLDPFMSSFACWLDPVEFNKRVIGAGGVDGGGEAGDRDGRRSDRPKSDPPSRPKSDQPPRRPSTRKNVGGELGKGAGAGVPGAKLIYQNLDYGHEVYRASAGILKLFDDAAEAEEELAMLQLLRDVPGVVPLLHDSVVAVDGRSCLAMREVVERADQRDAKTLCMDAARLCQTVAQIHHKNVYHLDLKPENVLLSSEKGPVVIDLGHARSISASAVINIRCFGTPGYRISTDLRCAEDAQRADEYGVSTTILSWLGVRELPEVSDKTLKEALVKYAARPVSMRLELNQRGFVVDWCYDGPILPKIMNVVGKLLNGSASLLQAALDFRNLATTVKAPSVFTDLENGNLVSKPVFKIRTMQNEPAGQENVTPALIKSRPGQLQQLKPVNNSKPVPLASRNANIR